MTLPACPQKYQIPLNAHSKMPEQKNESRLSRAETHTVRSFIYEVQQRLNRQRLLTCLLWSALFAGIAMLIVALLFVLPGYSVPTIWYAILATIALLAGVIVWLFQRITEPQAAHFADQFFGLKDSVRSCSGFEQQGLDGEFHRLQKKQANKQANESSLNAIRYNVPYRVAILASVLIFSAAALGFKSPSEAIVAKQQFELATAKTTLAINEQIKELVDELDESLDDEEERKLVNPDELRKWVDELKQTKDQKEAMRQYARLERKINKATEALQQRRDEKLLSAAGEELKKDRASKALGEKLKQKKYEQAAKELEDLKPEKSDGELQKKLSEKRKELAKLKAAAKRMAETAKSLKQKPNEQKGKQQKANSNKNSNQNSQATSAKSSNRSSSQSSESSSDESGDENSEMSESELSEMMEELDEAIEDYDDILEKAEKNDQDMDDQDLEECEKCESQFSDKLKKLTEKLKQMAKRRKARSKLKQLSQQCANSQSGLMQMWTQSKGGKKAGKGTSDVTRDQKDAIKNNDQFTRLKGLKGNGPSLTKTESANDGTGVSGRKSAAKKRNFSKQFESFVQREDVPEDLKSGVKNYFTQIHEGQSSLEASAVENQATEDESKE